MSYRTVISVLLCLCVFGQPLMAAEPSHDLATLTLPARTEIIVRTTNGQEVRGRLVSVDAEGVTLTRPDGGETRLARDEVSRLWRRGDSLKNGAIIGGVIGLAGAVAGQSECTDCSGEVALGIALGVPIWAGIGAWIDRLHVGRTLVYEAPGNGRR
jgi:hypothetical protein